MTRFQFLPYPMHGHVNPMIPLVAELVKRGDEVAVTVPADYADPFREVGCHVDDIAITVIKDFPEKPSKQERAELRRTGIAMLRQRSALARTIRKRWRGAAPDVVVADLAARWGAIAAKKARLPFVSFSVTYAASEEMVLDGLRQRHSARYVATVRRLGLLGQFHPSLRDTAALALVNSPPELQPRRETFGARHRFVGPLLRDTSGYGDEDLPWERLENRRTLYVSPGTVFGCRPEFFLGIAKAFADTEWTVVMATAALDPAELGELPANVIARRYVPQGPVLRRCDVFLTRASMNSAMEAVLCGVPMISVPRAYDQKGVAARLEQLGVAVTLEGGADGAAVLAAARQLAADDSVRLRLAELAEPIRRADPVGAATEALQTFAARL